VVGLPRDVIERYFADVEPARTITMPYGLQNEELGRSILVARRPFVPLDQAWPDLQRYE
jgi:hypothetical protein